MLHIVYRIAPAFPAAFIVVLTILSGTSACLSAQVSIGVGFHLTPPINFDHSKTPYVVVMPLPGLGGSLSVQQEWSLERDRRWYIESGITLQGLRYRQTNYYGDSLAIWGESVNQHTGFPGSFAGAGYSFPLGKSKGRVSVGGDVTLTITQDLGSISSVGFGIKNDPTRHRVFPVSVRLSLAYVHDFCLFRSVSSQVKIYTNISAQDISYGTQFIHNKTTGLYKEGYYRVNNSELGIKLFSSMSRKAQKKPLGITPSKEVAIGESKKRQKFIMSLNGQLFTGNSITYYIPQVDSFSISSSPMLLPQIAMTAELALGKNQLWHTVFSLGIGKRSGTLKFKSDGNFPSLKQPIHFQQSIDVGHYGIVNLGVSRKHKVLGLQFSHMLTASAVMLLEKEHAYFGVPSIAGSNQSAPYEDAILEGWMDYANGRENVVWGVEYNPEWVFNLRAPVFIGLGLVANYSIGGDVIAQGTFKVSNDHTTYYGGALQKFSKLGISMRVGLLK